MPDAHAHDNPVIAAALEQLASSLVAIELSDLASEYLDAIDLALKHDDDRPKAGWGIDDPCDMVEHWPAKVTREQLLEAQAELRRIDAEREASWQAYLQRVQLPLTDEQRKAAHAAALRELRMPYAGTERQLAEAVLSLLAERDDATDAAAYMSDRMRAAMQTVESFGQDGRIDEHVYSELAVDLEDQHSDINGDPRYVSLQQVRAERDEAQARVAELEGAEPERCEHGTTLADFCAAEVRRANEPMAVL